MPRNDPLRRRQRRQQRGGKPYIRALRREQWEQLDRTLGELALILFQEQLHWETEFPVEAEEEEEEEEEIDPLLFQPAPGHLSVSYTVRILRLALRLIPPSYFPLKNIPILFLLTTPPKFFFLLELRRRTCGPAVDE